MALGRLRHTERKLTKDPLLLAAYKAMFDEYLEKGVHNITKTVLAWIRSESGRYKEFVANRVGEIQEATKGTDWRWVPTSENPADIATSFEIEISFEPTDMWYTGPEFLKRPEEEWPKEAKGKDLRTILATRMLKLGDDSRVSLSSDVECGRKSGELIRKISQRLLPEKKFEIFADIERCVMVVWKAAKLLRDKTQKKRPRLHRSLTRLLNLEDFSSLNRLVCRAAAVQKDARFWYKKTFHKSGELNLPWKAAMENNKVRPEVTTLVQWVQTDKAPAEQKTPAILSSDHYVTELLIQAEHERCAHQGSKTLLNNLLGRFWIIDGRQTVLQTIRKCPRRHVKRWVIIFTCLVTRAIHLEVGHPLSTDEFMMGLSRLIDTRGRPDTIYSDNETNFVGASKSLKRCG
ncbi:hypothetical protein LAZ67_14002006 [Cordylochernes scorpioides]|uniref:Integrase catalytic domain-containing protein n=1 Tax=Cordylochernes scorpioides TaxID=51811 RepID=A0ABY6L6L1_9ARAC|nr:hypothetical protein LAZ67_14002006 [Cordylochernes scorpioides]